MTDLDLLTQYQRTASPKAFAELVRRNAPLVWSAARRQIADVHLAEDVTQAVFLLLARKSHSVRGSVAGWLIQTTRYAAADARKRSIRRHYHERRAAMTQPRETSNDSEAQWEAYAPVLDEAIGRLRTSDRDAVVLRFMRGLSLREVGEALGLSEDAARKRVERSVDRLRAMISKSAVVPSSTVLAMHLAGHSVEAPPAHLMATLGPSAAEKSAVVQAVARGTRHAIFWAKIKIAAILLLGAGLAGTGAVIAQQVVHSQPSPDPARAVVAAQTEPALVTNSDIEADVPGEVQLVRWDVLLNQAGFNALAKVAQPTPSASRIYQGYSANGYELRQCIADAIANNGVQDISHTISFATDSPNDPPHIEFPAPPYFGYRDPSRPRAVQMSGRPLQLDEDFQRQENGIHLNLNDSGFQFQIGFGGPMSTLKNSASIVHKGTLAPGNAIAFSCKITSPGNPEYDQLEVFEAFKAKTADMGFFQCQQNSGWWCQNGPAKIRQWIATADDWLSRAPEPQNLAPQNLASQNPPTDHANKLDDGRIIRIAGLSRPSVAPFCWWTSDGNPISVARDHLPFDGDPPKGLWAAVELTGGSPESQFQTPSTQPVPQAQSDAPLMQFYLIVLADESQLKVGIPTGPWTEIGRLDLAGQTTIDGINYKTSDSRKTGPDGFGVILSRTDATDILAVSAVGADGKDILQSTRIESVVFEKSIQGLNIPGGGFTARFSGISMEDVQYLRLYQRKRQWVTLTGFAAQPLIPLPAN